MRVLTFLGIGAVGLSALFLARENASNRATAQFQTVAAAKAKNKNAKNNAGKEKKVPPVLNFSMNSLTGKPVALSQYNSKVILMVNTASQCGFTSQYDGLQKLYAKYGKQGLVILGFPANDFGEQEPGTNEEIGEFCRKNYGVTFPMFAKIAVTGAQKAPLYKFLTEEKTNSKFAGEVGWNFEKFLISRDGKIVNRFRSQVAPNAPELVAAVEKELKQNTTKTALK